MSALGMDVSPSLRFLLSPRRRSGRFMLDVPGTDTVGHVVRMVGIPPTEIGDVLLDGRPVDLSARPTAGPPDGGAPVLEIRPGPRPQPTRRSPPAFLLDVHLASLARRLRLLGLDTAWEQHAGDADLVDRAERELRVLLTRDRGLLHRGALTEGALVRGDDTEVQVADVLARFAPPLAPWTRCVRCNALLRDAALSEVADLLPAGTRGAYDTFRRCRGCGRVFWRGAHAQRLDALVGSAREQVAAARGRPGR
jgi:uncharacterized protein